MATSRGKPVYVPNELGRLRDRAVAMIDEIRWATSRTSRNFMGAVIDKRAFAKISAYLTHARGSATIPPRKAGAATGTSHPTLGRPTIQATCLLCEEIFDRSSRPRVRDGSWRIR